MSATKKTVIACICCAVLVLAGKASAEGIFGGKTFGQRMDDLGRTLFGTGTSEDKTASPDAAVSANTPQDPPTAAVPSAAPRAGSVMPAPAESRNRYGDGAPAASAPTMTADRSNAAPAAPRYSDSPSPPAGNPRPYRPLLGTSLLDDEPSADSAAAQPQRPGAGSQQSAAKPVTVGSPGNPNPPARAYDFGPPPSRPIHDRLMQSRSSAFKTPGSSASANPPPAQPAAEDHGAGNAAIVRQPAVSISPAPRRANTPTAVAEPTPAVRPKPSGEPTLAKRPSQSNVPIVAQRPAQARRTDGAISAPDIPAPKAEPAMNPARIANPTIAAKDDALLFTRRGPVLSVETLGPRKIVVGKESAYEVVLMNSGEVAAEELTVFVSLPEWAEVAGAEATNGTPQYTTPGQASAPFQWRLGRLDAKAKEKLALRIIPRQSKPFDLAVRWDYKPVASQAMIEVQEPKLELQLDGPRDVLYGKKETYRLRMTNAGTGPAENVVVKLMPIGTGDNVPATYQLGLLPAGESKNIEIELTARQVGDLSIQVEANGDAGVHAELAEKVLVRRAGLEVLVEGPKLQYVGSVGTYLVHVRNPGNAPAMNIRFTVNLPAGVKYVGGVEGARADAAGKLQWALESLNPQLEQVYALKCRLQTAGATRFEVSAAAEDELSTVAGANTQVDAAASLTLDVVDPAGPIAVAEESVYEVHVRNRGTKEAEGVEVIGFFSRGIEPTSAAGAPNRIGSGQVVFSPLASLAPGAEAVLKVRAKAETAGNHVFRAEVHCKAMGTRLISEKNTLYYQDNLPEEDARASGSAEANRNLAAPENYRTQRQ